MHPLKRMMKNVFEDFEWGSSLVKPTRWQGQDVSARPEAQMMEDLHVHLQANLCAVESLAFYRMMVEPNLPWADNHFAERVCGYPINPGIEWANWPWGVNAEKALDGKGQFNHNYMERYWPRIARNGIGEPTRDVDEFKETVGVEYPFARGIRHSYGDLGGLVRDLAHEPDTRQSYLPVWFPEDTGDAHKGRKPCTLGYHFIMRDGKLDVVYYLRSCDLAHHFRDDVYLTIRLLLWVLDECRKINPQVWDKVSPGRLVMQITSLHMFINDYRRLYPE